MKTDDGVITRKQVAIALKPFKKASVTFVKAITEEDLARIRAEQAERAALAQLAQLKKRQELEKTRQNRAAGRVQYEVRFEGAKSEHSKAIRTSLQKIDGVKRVRFYAKTSTALATVEKGDIILTVDTVGAALKDLPDVKVTQVGVSE